MNLHPTHPTSADHRTVGTVTVAAVQAQVARSTQFLLPSVASVEVAEELARRYPVG